ncbi:hypothetical protein EZV62_022802 [Acer yangbiense]|uniref:Peroxisomal membrane protein PEX14 n=1 Tax=Acer yangbiense TaxID=1000413 RepID=A0A5C7GZR3_9ROSI|nr:hypothetical protein EZV62_022802 [Acer yangbiense]
MATVSPAPPNPTAEDPPTSATEIVQPKNEVQQDSQAEAPKPISEPSVFKNSESMREDQVQNAVKFLSHPKVRGSPVMYRRSFLEKKGLTKEEIDEAFRRVPDPSPSAQATSTNQAGQVKPSSNIQPQAPTQALQIAAAAPTGAISPGGSLMLSRFHWYHAVFAVGLLAVSGAGTAVLIKNSFVPRLKSWIRKVVLEDENDIVKKTDAKPSLAEEAAAAAKAAAAAATDVAKASQEMLNSKNNEKRYFEEFMSLLDVQVQEMKSMNNAIRKLEGQSKYFGKANIANQEDHRVSMTNVKIMAMVQRGEKPSNIRDINDQRPNPNQNLSSSRLAPRSKAQNGSRHVLQSEVSAEGLYYMVQDDGLNHQLDNKSSVPWWQRKNVRISEVENEDELKSGPNGAQTLELPVRRTWVPPQPPPVAMAEAAEAIRRPKPSVQNEQLAGDQSVSRPSDVTDELQRITKISETGNAEEINGGSSVLNSNVQVQHQSYQLATLELIQLHGSPTAADSQPSPTAPAPMPSAAVLPRSAPVDLALPPVDLALPPAVLDPACPAPASPEPSLVPSAAALVQPAVPPVPSLPVHHMTTRFRDGIRQPKVRTDGTVRYPLSEAHASNVLR